MSESNIILDYAKGFAGLLENIVNHISPILLNMRLQIQIASS